MGLYVVSIHDGDPSKAFVRFDLRDILAALGEVVDRYMWCVLDIEVTGERAEAIHARVDAAPEKHLWLSSAELRELASDIEQTIDGTVAAYLLDTRRENLPEHDMSTRWFPTNQMQLVIAAVDSSCFDVYAKENRAIERITAAFKDVRAHDAAEVFGSEPPADLSPRR